MITIGIPVYNGAAYISDALESALSQTVKAEVIVVNDGSKDGSSEIAKKFGVKVIDQVNKGLPSARNTLIMNMTGDYLLPLDADDILKDNAVERITQVIEETGADIVAPSFKEFGLSNREVNLSSDPVPGIADFKVANRIGYFSAMRKTKLLEVGGYNPKMLWGYEDFDLTFDLLKRGAKLVTMPDRLVLYRTKEKSMIHTALAHHNELIAQIVANHPEVWATQP